MAANYLPTADNVTLLNAWLYFQQDGDPRPRSLGYVDSFTTTPNTAKAEKSNGNSGVSEVIKTRVTEQSVDVAMSLAETATRNMALALQGKTETLTQSEQTQATHNETNVVPGELVDTGSLDISNVSVTGSSVELVEGVDFVVYPESGTILVYSAQDQFDVTFDAAAIAAEDDRNVIKILSEANGIRGVVTLIGTNPDGQRYKLEFLRVELTADGEVAFISNDGEFQSVSLTGKTVRNDAVPQYPNGRLTPLKRAA